MISLRGCSEAKWDAEPFVLRLTMDYHRPGLVRSKEGLLLHSDGESLPPGFRAYVRPSMDRAGKTSSGRICSPRLQLPHELSYLTEGDIVRIAPQHGTWWVLYRRGSSSNTIILSEYCNCDCIFCPQPPKRSAGGDWTQLWLEVVPLMAVETPALAITGGEPTMNPQGLLSIIQVCKDHLPKTALHVLSNGRMFNYVSLCTELSAVGHPGLLFAVPLYSDLASVHDFIVQAEGAFDQTIRGLMNLKRCGHRIELRIVLVRQNVERLPELARFITRNLPFVDHVALMGLELMGYATAREESLWVDPEHYQAVLETAVDDMACHHMDVSIYNHPLCVLKPRLRAFAQRSISDWKAEFSDACEGCGVRGQCGGMFASVRNRYAGRVHPI